MTAVVSKQSIRELVKLHRLPSKLYMVLIGAWLQDILTANKLDVKLWSMTYWVTVRNLNTKQMRITWRPL